MASLGWRRAGAEFMVIFAGVSVGLVADDWRQGREDARDAVEVLRLIAQDLQADSAELVRVSGFYQRHAVAVSWLQHSWRDPAEDPDSLGMQLRRLVFRPSPQLRSSAFSSLLSGNRLSLLQDEQLRASVVRYYEEDQARLMDYFGQHERLHFDLHRSLDPHILIMEGAEPGRILPTRSGPVTVTSGWAVLRQDNAIYNIATNLGAVAEVTERFIGAALANNSALRSSIEASITK